MNFLSYLINGISLGSVYAIIALGYTMVYGIAKMLNFAHGDVIMVGCYIVFMTMSGQGWGAVPAVVLSIIVCTVLGIVIEKIAYKPLRKAAPLAVLITAIGVSYFLENAALLIFGADTRSFTNVVTLPALKLAGGALTISGTTIVTFLACVVIMAALMLFIKKTKAGQAMLAVSEDKDAAQLMGVNVNATISLTFAIGSGLAAVAGVLFCSAYPDTDTVYGCNAWYQGVHSRCIRRDRFHSGSIDRRDPSWCDRDFRPRIYLVPVIRCNRVCSPDHCASCEAFGNFGQTGS